MDKKSARIRRATRARRKLKELGATRTVVHRTPRHIYAQVIARMVLKSGAASTVEKAISEQLKYTGNKEAAAAVGKAIAERALEKGVRTCPSTALVSNIMVVSGHWQMLPVKLAFSSKVEV